MAARQLASWRPLCFTEVGLCFCPRTYFFRRQISEVSGPIVTNLCRMFGGDCSFKNLVRNLGVHPPKIWRPKNVKILARFRTSRREQDSVDRIVALETAVTSLREYQIWWTLVHKRRKTGPAFRPTQSTFSDSHISGAKGRCPLKISQLVEDDQRLLMHTSLGMGLPPTIF